mmetsp:Transcript_8272/g.14824  ORF Transcript_8272/g.14824 Transcript_8272/m.14824 type:complete len:177 (-) Transcript_8272:149-679(-)
MRSPPSWIVLLALQQVAGATNATTSTATVAPWASWSMCSGTWRCEGGCYHPLEEQCIALPGLITHVDDQILARECDEKGGIYGHVCNCKCIEQLHCKFGCYVAATGVCEDREEDRCTSWRRHRSWERKCRCIEVTTYYTTFAENVTFPNPNSCRMVVHLAFLVKVIFLFRILAYQG